MSVEAKGKRLAGEGRVKGISPAWTVVGDNGKYVVYADENSKVVCTCPFSGPCSHIAAVLFHMKDTKSRSIKRARRARRRAKLKREEKE